VTSGRRLVAVITLACVAIGVLGSVGVPSYWAGHRAGRGAACFQAATHVRDSDGRTLAATYLGLAGARADYTFWGQACTVSIGIPRQDGWIGGRWVYDTEAGRLFHTDEGGARLFPASGMWPALGAAGATESHGTAGDEVEPRTIHP
jgi:hypothetical protein